MSRTFTDPLNPLIRDLNFRISPQTDHDLRAVAAHEAATPSAVARRILKRGLVREVQQLRTNEVRTQALRKKTG
jgi:hypothetical protein